MATNITAKPSKGKAGLSNAKNTQKGGRKMISKREWYAALRRMLKRAALVFGGLFLMAAFFYWRVFDLRLEAALLATLSAVLTGYGFA
jgi:hypothetical protein